MRMPDGSEEYVPCDGCCQLTLEGHHSQLAIHNHIQDIEVIKNPPIAEVYDHNHHYRSYYASLPVMWREIPPINGKIVEMHTIRIDEDSKFKGTIADYPRFRTYMMQSVHRNKMPVAGKAFKLLEGIPNGSSSALLRALKETNDHSAASYRNIIEELEQEYGDVTHVMNAARATLVRGPEVNLDNQDSVQGFRLALQTYRHHASQLGTFERDFAPNSTLLEDVLSKRFNISDKIKVLTKMEKEGRPPCLDGIADFILKKLNKIRWAGRFDQAVGKKLQPLRLDVPAAAKANAVVNILQTDGNDSLDDPFEPHMFLPCSTMVSSIYCTLVESSDVELLSQTAEDEETETCYTAWAGYEKRMQDAKAKGRPPPTWRRNQRVPPKCDFYGKKDTCMEPHLLRNCPPFIEMSEEQRMKHLARVGRCFLCFSKEHSLSTCKSPARCRTCEGMHNTLIHSAYGVVAAKVNARSQSMLATCLATHTEELRMTSLPSVPLRMARSVDDYKKGKYFEANALCDTGATMTLMSRNVLDELKLDYCEEPLNLGTLNGSREHESRRAHFELFTVDGVHVTRIKGTAIPNLKISDAVDWNRHKSNFSWLKDIDFPKPVRDGRIDLLFGHDLPGILRPQESKYNKENAKDFTSPVASKYIFGWASGGPTVPPPEDAHHMQVYEYMLAKEREDLKAEMDALNRAF